MILMITLRAQNVKAGMKFWRVLKSASTIQTNIRNKDRSYQIKYMILKIVSPALGFVSISKRYKSSIAFRVTITSSVSNINFYTCARNIISSR